MEGDWRWRISIPAPGLDFTEQQPAGSCQPVRHPDTVGKYLQIKLKIFLYFVLSILASTRSNHDLPASGQALASNRNPSSSAEAKLRLEFDFKLPMFPCLTFHDQNY